ncbi:MAG: aspartyl protease family protein [Thermoplasmata archaeon]
MPTYRIPNPRLRDEGPVLRVRVGLPQSVSGRASSEDRHGSEPIEVDALVDTGSGRSVIHPEVARRLDLTPVGSVEIDTPSSTDVPAFEHWVRFWFDPTTSVEVKVLEAQLPVARLRALLGRDVLAQGRFLYEGKLGAFTLTF